jgi:anthraniloyl-CoA monooxygenase
MTGIHAVSPEGRISPADQGIYNDGENRLDWLAEVAAIKSHSGAMIGIQLGHAGRRGSTRPRSEGLDRPLLEGGWPVISASLIPYVQNPKSKIQNPKEMDRADMDRVRDDFVRAARTASEAGFDLLQLHMAHGYLLASYLSPLTNVRQDDYGGNLENRMRYPLEVFDAVRAAWPQDKPISVAITATDCVRGGAEVEDAVAFARALKAHGCDLIEVLAGQTTPDSEPAYGRGFLTHYSDRIRNEAGIPTMVGGYLTTSNDVNTVLAAGRADLCILTFP